MRPLSKLVVRRSRTGLLVMCFYLPFRLAFLSSQLLSWPGDAWLLAIDVIYMLDMLVGMSTAHYDYLGNLEASAHRRHDPNHQPSRTP